MNRFDKKRFLFSSLLSLGSVLLCCGFGGVTTPAAADRASAPETQAEVSPGAKIAAYRKGLYSWADQIANLKEKGGSAEFPNFLEPGEKITHLILRYIEIKGTAPVTKDIPVTDDVAAVETISVTMTTSVHLRFKITYKKDKIVFTEANPSFNAENSFALRGLKTSKGETLYFRFDPKHCSWPADRVLDLLYVKKIDRCAIGFSYQATLMDEKSGMEKYLPEAYISLGGGMSKIPLKKGAPGFYSANIVSPEIETLLQKQRAVYLLQKGVRQLRMRYREYRLRNMLQKAFTEIFNDKFKVNWSWYTIKTLYTNVRQGRSYLGYNFDRLPSDKQKEIREFVRTNAPGAKIADALAYERGLEEFPSFFLFAFKDIDNLDLPEKKWISGEVKSLKELSGEIEHQIMREEIKLESFLKKLQTAELRLTHDNKTIVLKRVNVKRDQY